MSFMKTITQLSLCLASIGMSHAWQPGPASSSALLGYSVDTSTRSDVLSFYHHIYLASENHGHLLGWTGDHGTCNQGTISDVFAQAVQRRVNYYRAMAGVAANTTMNTNSLVVLTSTPSYNPPANTTKSQAAMQSALLLSRTNVLTHDPVSGTCLTNAAANGSNLGNIALGINGTTAMDYYMKEDEFNIDAGHRRWMLFDRATNFATGDIPYAGTYRASNSMYVRQAESEMTSPPPKFVPWPNGYTPWDHSTPYWSLSYPGGNFSSATVTVTQNGNPISTNIVSRANGYGNNSIIWRVLDFPQVRDDVTYQVSVNGIGGGGPSSHNYSITFFDPNRIPDGPVVSGSLSPQFPAENYAFTSTAGVDDYRLEVGRLENASFIEGAEDATASMIVVGPITDYNLRQTSHKQAGAKAFRLAYTVVTQNEQWFMIDRVVVPNASSSISYQLRRGYMRGITTFSVEYSTDSVNWTTLPNSALTGNNTGIPVDSAFTLRTNSIPAELANKPVRFRFAYKKLEPSEFSADQDPLVGAFVDSISFSNCRTMATRTRTTIPSSTNQFAFNSTTAGGALQNGQYMMFVQPRIASSYFSAGNALIVTANDGGITPNIPPTLNVIANPASINENAPQQSVPLSGISAGSGESQSVTVTATSSNNALIPNPTVAFNSATSVYSVLYTPVANQHGSAIITVTVNDGQSENNTISRNFTVTVLSVDSAPDIESIGAQSVNEDQFIEIPFTITDIDSPVTAPTVRAASNAPLLLPASSFLFTGTGANRTLRITPAANRFGNATVSLTITNAGKSTTKEFQVTVNPVNDAPFITKPPVLKSIAENAKPFVLTITGISPGLLESQVLTITATSSNPAIVPNPVIMHIPGSTTASMTYTPVPHANGSVVIQLTLNDGAETNNIRVYDMPLVVTPVDSAPDMQQLENQFVDEDQFIDVPVTIMDIDSPTTPATLKATSNNALLLPATSFSFSGTEANRSMRIRPAANRFGTATVSLTVTNFGKSVTKQFQVTVNPVNDAPFIAKAPVLKAMAEDAKPFVLTISGLSSGLFETQPLTITATSSHPEIVPNPVISHIPGSTMARMTYSPAANANGAVVISLTLNDGSETNNIRVYEMPLTITPVDDAPTISAISPITQAVNAAIPVIPFTVNDVDLVDLSSLVVTVTSSNIKMLPLTGIALGGSGSDRTLTLTPLPNVTGKANITITVTSGKLKATRIIAVTLTPAL